MTVAFALTLAATPVQDPSPAWIDSVSVQRAGQSDYRVTIRAKKARPYIQTFPSYAPPNVYAVNDLGRGPAVLVHGFDPQADFLTVVARRSGRWVISETIYARYGIVVAHGRSGELSIEARIPRERTPRSANLPEWEPIRYVLNHGSLRETKKTR
jgi:hypothetical protein